MLLTKKCLICKGGSKNDCLYWHRDAEKNKIWVWCQGRCQRGYSLEEYCRQADVDLEAFLRLDFDIKESQPNEVQAMSWPARFIPLSDPRAQKGVDYVKTRGLTLDGDMYYDLDRNGVVFPYYFGNHFVGAQTRFIVPKKLENNEEQKIDTLPGTRLGLLFYGWNQSRFMGNVKGVIVTEGAFNAISLNQALTLAYGGIARNPWRAVACSGSGATEHQKETIKELKDQGLKVIISPDTDEAGKKMLNKYIEFGAATHWCITGDTDRDWNDVLKQVGHKELAKTFLSSIKKV